jgi:hypothetical protein
MPDDDANVLAVYRKAIEGRLAEQMARHTRVSSGTDPKRVVDIQIAQERERLEKAMREAESQIQIDVYRALLEWLSELAQKLKSRC